jgi:glycosyltransferase involved in cell wall biosynthesis
MGKQNLPPVLALEISTLGDRLFTGIPNVTKSIAREMLADQSIEARFFMLRAEVPRRIVERLVTLDTGDILWWLSGRLNARPSFDFSFPRSYIGIYPGPKRHRRLFPIEVQIIHDLTAVITPQFHTPDTVKFYQNTLLRDMLTSDLLIAVSEATKLDIRTYFPQVAHIPCAVAPLAPCVAKPPTLPEARKPVDYVLVLGTVEPRKNVRFSFACLADHPEILSNFKFVFVGRWGWGEAAQKLLNVYGLAKHAKEGKIVFTGFVSDAARDALMAAASVVLYPSRYEGFGLPVIEALSLGTPVITSYSSSLPEVGGDVVSYCEIETSEGLFQALQKIVEQTKTSTESARSRESRKAWADNFSWRTTYGRIKDAALAAAQTRNN